MINQIMQTAAETGLRHFESLDKVATNISNINTNGYKIKRFEHYMTADGRLEGVKRTDYSQGSHMMTKRELDVAIEGPGFIPVTQPDGTVAYTRDGSLAKNQDGMLVTNFGDIVGEGIQLPVNYQKLFIRPNGDIEVLLKDQRTPKKIGEIQLVRFPNPEGLKEIGYNKVVTTEASGEPEPSDSQLKQGTLERSNVNVFYQVDQILRMNASIISNIRIVKFGDDIFRQSANLRQ